MSLNLSALALAIKGDLVTPDQSTYAAAIARWASNSERNAKVVAFVKDAQDIVAALKFARENGLPVAVKGGGHHVGGASSSENGLVVDLSRYLGSVTV